MKRLPVDLDELCWAMEDHTGEISWWLDPESGALWCWGEPGQSDADDPEALTEDQRAEWEALYRRLVRVETIDSSEAYRDMEDFVDGLPDGAARDALARALDGSRPFRRFKDAIERFPEVREAWFAFHERRMRERAVQWLAELDIEPVDVRGSGQGGFLPHWLEE